MSNDKLMAKAIDTIRILAADGVQKANSGHPGMPMGCADYAFALWYKFMRHNPADPRWLGRDRFVLSAGHGSMLVYSLLHLFEYGLEIEDLKNFRQWHSRTPGHPEYGHTAGVEVTTGPLGTGFASAVGMAIANKQFSARLGNEELFRRNVFTIAGDGCMMEGVTSEAASLAGHNKLDNIICFYDDNQITIEGSTDLAFSENVAKRFEAYGWNVLRANGQDPVDIERALAAAIAHRGSPTLIVGRTTIGFGAPTKAGSHSTHGEPLGDEELAATKKALGFDPEQFFFVADDVRELFYARVQELKAEAAEWQTACNDWRSANPDKAELMDALTGRTVPDDILEQLVAAVPEKKLATRASGGELLQKAAELVPALTGGAADLAPSTKTLLKNEEHFSADNYAGRNLHFGVREFAMGTCANGMALTGTTIPYVATFAVFSDFMKPALRLAAIQGAHVVFVYTHDSVFVGEDGPTHQPIEQLSMLRAIPGLTVIRPAESYETAHAWAAALKQDGPVAMFLTRQGVENIPEAARDKIDVARGAYVLSDDKDFELLVIATGSEVMTCHEAVETLRAQGRRVRLVSMPSRELFEAQPEDYRESVLPSGCKKRVIVEAATTFGWEKYAGETGLMIGIDHFGDSAPAGVIAEEYGLTAAKIATKIAGAF